tara:strand:- start:1771 stop:2244 length:474 start_codon:yes stop_codon:yes gene_type:complete
MPLNSEGGGYFTGVDGSKKGESAAIFADGTVITDTMAKSTTPKKPRKKKELPVKENKKSAQSSEVQKIEPEKLLEDLLPSGFNAIVSEKLESGKAWHFPYSNTYMVNKDDWNMFLTQITAIVGEARKSESLELNTIKPSDDPALGPLMGLMGDIFSA